jgi:hypothetical protein
VVSDRHDKDRERESVSVYATGASVTFNIKSNSIFVNVDDLEATSSDEDVLTVEDGLGDTMRILTASAGSAELVFRSGGDVVDSRRIVVRDPAEIRLEVELFADTDDDLLPDGIAVFEPLRALRGRESRLVMHTFDDDGEELFGNALTAAVAPPGWALDLDQEGPYSVLVLAPGEDAIDGDVTLLVGGPLLTVEYGAVVTDVTDIERIVLNEGGSDGARNPGRTSFVLAKAEDAAGNPLLGNPGWQLEGADAGIGFAVAYKVGFGVPGQELVARLGPVEARRTIYAESNSVQAIDGEDCSQGGHLPVLAFGLVFGAVFSFPRRTSRRASIRPAP